MHGLRRLPLAMGAPERASRASVPSARLDPPTPSSSVQLNPVQPATHWHTPGAMHSPCSWQSAEQMGSEQSKAPQPAEHSQLPLQLRGPRPDVVRASATGAHVLSSSA